MTQPTRNATTLKDGDLINIKVKNPDKGVSGCIRMNGGAMTQPNAYGGGQVNLQQTPLQYEKFLVHVKMDGTTKLVAFESVQFPMRFIRASALDPAKPHVNCQFEISPGSWEWFEIIDNSDGTVSIQSNHFSGWYLSAYGCDAGLQGGGSGTVTIAQLSTSNDAKFELEWLPENGLLCWFRRRVTPVRIFGDVVRTQFTDEAFGTNNVNNYGPQAVYNSEGACITGAPANPVLNFIDGGGDVWTLDLNNAKSTPHKVFSTPIANAVGRELIASDSAIYVKDSVGVQKFSHSWAQDTDFQMNFPAGHSECVTLVTDGTTILGLFNPPRVHRPVLAAFNAATGAAINVSLDQGSPEAYVSMDGAHLSLKRLRGPGTGWIDFLAVSGGTKSYLLDVAGGGSEPNPFVSISIDVTINQQFNTPIIMDDELDGRVPAAIYGTSSTENAVIKMNGNGSGQVVKLKLNSATDGKTPISLIETQSALFVAMTYGTTNSRILRIPKTLLEVEGRLVADGRVYAMAWLPDTA